MKTDLLCEYRNNPAGVDNAAPLLSWAVDDPLLSRENAHITLWQQGCDEPLWQSGALPDEGRAVYGGAPLKSGRTYLWQVVLEKGGIRTDLGKARFTMGLLSQDEWKSPFTGGIRIDAKCYLYRREWVCEKPVRCAAAFLASPNYNQLTVNGQKPDHSLLNNTFANYDKSLYYATYDLTGLIRQGCNAFGVMTGLGWRSLREAEDGIGWGDSLFALQIMVEYMDGSSEWLYSPPETWRFATDGPIVYNSIYNGEIYDARLEKEGWDSPGYDDSLWDPCVEKEPPEGVLRSQLLESIQIVRELAPERIIPVEDGTWTLDFGKNMAGLVRLKLQGEAGQQISIRPAELIYANGDVDPTSLRGAHPVDTYVCKGQGIEEWMPRFTYHGFRYAQISGLKEKPDKSMFTACMVRSAVERTGHFTSSDPILQGFYDMVIQTEESNLHGVPTDCPQRDERLGWLNDMTVRNEGAMYSFRMYQLYAKWLRDIRDTQGKVTGAITDTAPFLRYGFRPADPVSGSFLQLPWNLYLHYGDDRIIRENYEANAKWVHYLLRNRENGIVRYSSMGDWAAPVGGTDHTSTGGGALSLITPPLLMSTGFLYQDCILMAKMAKSLCREQEENHWLQTAAEVKAAFNREFFHPAEEYYGTNSQAANVLALYFDLVEPPHIPGVLRRLVEDIQQNGCHLTTGNICTRYAIEVLFRLGQGDLAWRLLTQTEYPGWGFMLKNGATTVWERWEQLGANEFMAEMASMNHPMNGGAVVSLFKHLVGLCPDENAPGWKNIILRPVFPAAAPDASASVMTVQGLIQSSWKRQDETIRMDFTVPGLCTAEVYLPGEESPRLFGAGHHSVSICTKQH